MIKKTILLFILATFSSYINAQSISQLNSAISTIDINQAIVQKISPIPYAGRDLVSSNMNGLNTPTLHTSKIIC